MAAFLAFSCRAWLFGHFILNFSFRLFGVVVDLRERRKSSSALASENDHALRTTAAPSTAIQLATSRCFSPLFLVLLSIPAVLLLFWTLDHYHHVSAPSSNIAACGRPFCCDAAGEVPRGRPRRQRY